MLQINNKWLLALDLLRVMRQETLKRSLKDTVRFICGIMTKDEIEGLLRRNSIRVEILDRLNTGSVDFGDVAEKIGCSEKLVKRVWRAMCEEYPAETAASATFCVAIPKQQRARELVEGILSKAGFRIDEKSNVLVDLSREMEPIPFRFVRGSMVPLQLKFGKVQFGFVGNDKIIEARAETDLNQHSPLELDIRKEFEISADKAFRMRFAVPKEKAEEASRLGYAYLEGKTIATSYPETLKVELLKRGITAKQILKLDGDVEAACEDFKVDVVMDIVQSGNTLKNHGLVAIFAPVYEGNVSLLSWHSPPGRPVAHEDTMNRFVGRFDYVNCLKAA
jgi:ATP phosphoribosyltransferase